ncbi:MAG: LamG domain-containing protein [Planctomycetota bacterium]|jgi:hypothetical protein
MCRKLIPLTSLVVLLSCFSTANAGEGFFLKVDLTVNVGGEPVDYTYKGGDWIPWVRWGNDMERHDATNYQDIIGSGVNIGLGVGNGSSSPGTVLMFTDSDDEPICNTWIQSENGGVDANCHIVLYGDDGLTPGTYLVWGYHNTPDGNEPNIPRVFVQTYTAYYDPNTILMQNVGAPNDPDGGGVTQIHDEDTNDINVPISHVSFDDLLEPNVSLVKFYTDGSPVKITYEGIKPLGKSAIINAFIIYVPTPVTAFSPFPAVEEPYACPDTSLTWAPGEFTQDVNGHNVYFGTDLTEELVLFEDNLEANDANGVPSDANWVTSDWVIYDSNVLHDGNNDGNSHSSYHSFTPNSPGICTLTTVDINASEAGAMRVSLYIKKTLGIQAGDINLYYYNGTGWDFVKDLNSIGPNDVWLHYTDDVNESEYLISDFKIRLQSNISDISINEVYIDDVSVTNTWLLGPKWFKGTYDSNSYTPPSILDFNGTYYWRIDEVNDAHADSPWQGRTWSFTTEKGLARDPSPDDRAPQIPLAGTTLSWTSSCLADYHDVYFGTDFNDVNSASDPNSGPGKGRQTETDYPTGPLVYNNKYYWRIDEGGPEGLFKGEIWSFQTIGYPLMYFKFDGVLDANLPDPITDDAGNVTFDLPGNGEARYGQPNPMYNVEGTSAHFTYSGTGGYGGGGRPLIRSCFGSDILDLDGSEYTIEAWVRQDGDAENVIDNPVTGEDMEGTIIRKDRLTYGLGVDDNGAVRYMHNGHIISSGAALIRISKDQWYHIAAVFDVSEPSQKEKLYINGIVVAYNDDANSNPQDDFGSDTVGIGAYRYQSPSAKHLANHFDGAIDELRVVDRALTPEEFLIRTDPNLAWLPRPFNHAIDTAVTVDLEWEAGDHATSHEVYFGTSWYDVNDANNDANYWPDVFKGKQDPCSYTQLPTLDLAATYYWRIDEINDITSDRWKGDVWRFTIAESILIDNFDDDTAQDPPINDWYNGTVLGTGAQLSLRSTPPLIGENSMRYNYSNFFDWMTGYKYYSETQTQNLEPNDWNYYDIRVISLWFYGNTGNDATEDATQMNLGLEDDANYAVVWYGELEEEEITDVQIEDWQFWEVLTERFTNINFSDVKKICIGFGTRGWPVAAGAGVVYFDEINLYPPHCRPEKNPLEGDLSGDCTVAWEDVEIMAGEWLRGDVNVSPVQPPSEANLICWWKLDDGDGSIVTDYAGYDNNGVIETIDLPDVNVWWVPGYDGNSALEFDGGRVRVPDSNMLKSMNQVSVSAWVKFSEDQDAARIVVKGGNDKETFALEVDAGDDDDDEDQDGEVSFYVGDGNSYDKKEDEVDRYFTDSNHLENPIYRDEWNHIAGTYDGNSVRCYVNGELADVCDVNDIPFLSQDTNDLAIGSRPEDDDAPFEGIIDDVRIYDYGLSAEEVAYIATDGTGVFTVRSLANLYNDESLGDRVVNLRDFAKLADNWFKRKLWPE